MAGMREAEPGVFVGYRGAAGAAYLLVSHTLWQATGYFRLPIKLWRFHARARASKLTEAPIARSGRAASASVAPVVVTSSIRTV